MRTLIDLFAGCGGLSLGLEQSGFTPVYVNEIDKSAMDTYLSNRKELPLLHKENFHSFDILNAVKKKNLEKLKADFKNFANIKEIDLIVGGPPCQGYSAMGIRRSYEVDKNQLPSNYLYKNMIKFIDFFQPKIFLFENVSGILNSKWTKHGHKGEIFRCIQKDFNRLSNYFQDFKLIYSKNYGVPQNRPRVFLIGVRKDLNFEPHMMNICSGLLPEPTHDYYNIEDILGDLIDTNYKNNLKTSNYLNNPSNEIQKFYRRFKNSNKYLKKGDLLTHQEYSNHSARVEEKFLYMIKNNGKIRIDMQTKKFAQRVLPRKWDKKGPTITTTSLPDDYVHFSQPRSLTVREWARLQTFPDWYVFKGKRTTGGLRRAGNPQKGIFDRELPQYTQIGNAVPVLLANKIGNHFIKLLKKYG